MSLEQALDIHASLPVIDGHNDLPWALRIHHASSPSRGDRPSLHTDTRRLLQGGVGGQFWSVYVPAWTKRPFDVTNEQIDLVEQLCQADPQLELVRTAAEVKATRPEGKVAGLLGAEGGHSIEDSLDKLERLAARGLRYMTLTHADTIDWADSATDEARHGGLTAFGRDVIAAMNDLGVLVDISHVSAATMRDAIAASRVPVIASHSNAYAKAAHPRNVPDDVLRMIGETDGVVMVNFYPGFVNQSAAAAAIEMFAESRALMAELGDELAVENALAERRAGLPRGTIGEVADHIEHIAAVAGVACVGIGSDFDGIELTVPGLEDVSMYPNLTAELLERGWSEPDVRALLGDNILRVLEEAEPEKASAP